MSTYKEALQVNWQASRKTKDLTADGEELTLIGNRLLTEQPFTRSTYHTNFVAVFAQKPCTGNEGADLRAVADQDDVELLVTFFRADGD